MKSVRKNLRLPKDLVDNIEEFRENMMMTTFTSAIIELVRRGLKYKE